MRIIAFFIALLFFASIASVYAADTQINVRTLSDHKVSVFVLDASQTYYLLKSFYGNSDIYGKFSATYTGDTSKLSIRIIVEKDKKQVLSEKFGPYNSGAPVYIQALPGNLSSDYSVLDKAASAAQNTTAPSTNVSLKNETVNSSVTKNITSSIKNNTNQNVSNNTNNTISGNSIFDENSDVLKIVGYVIAGLILLMIIVFLFVRYGNRMLETVKGRPSAPSGSPKDIERQLRKTEKRLVAAEAELEKMKKMEKVREVEKKIQEEREELRRLKREL